ncbi:type II toxin-antitoxin system VapC family toxin [Kitasatospora purpeofusca]|uniref:type II toxin-antitoxin system VapC family toxin n=1 Tax=Kitasatospora purpeofusca TaxID=67352 RepID=UPI002E154E7C|nr:type II toxin-antitoxin system VapC family toxin [Kitasatospora purpeofusca]
MSSTAAADLVLDASAAVELLTGERRRTIAARLQGQVIAVPGHFDQEVLTALRGMLLGRKITLAVADRAVKELAAFPFLRVETTLLIERTWALKHNQYPGDGLYVALAERLSVPLVTTDGKLANASGVSCGIELIG